MLVDLLNVVYAPLTALRLCPRYDENLVFGAAYPVSLLAVFQNH